MDIKVYEVGARVRHNETPTSLGIIVKYGRGGGGSWLVEWDNGNVTWEQTRDITPIPPDNPRSRVGDLIAHWCKPVTKADLDAVRDIVQSAIDDCGLDAAATVAVYDNYNPRSLGYNPIKAEIKINNTFPAIRMRNGTVVKSMDTISVIFRRQSGMYDTEAYDKRKKVEEEIFKTYPKAEAMAAVDALPWDAESVEFSARTNGKARDYRKRHWYPFEGGIAGAGINHIGGHYGYADTWANLKEDFAAYLRSVAVDLGYAGKVWRKEVA